MFACMTRGSHREQTSAQRTCDTRKEFSQPHAKGPYWCFSTLFGRCNFTQQLHQRDRRTVSSKVLSHWLWDRRAVSSSGSSALKGFLDRMLVAARPVAVCVNIVPLRCMAAHASSTRPAMSLHKASTQEKNFSPPNFCASIFIF